MGGTSVSAMSFRRRRLGRRPFDIISQFVVLEKLNVGLYRIVWV